MKTPLFFLDSSACIPVLRNKAGVENLPDPTLTGIPIIVAAELWTGVKKSEPSHPNHARRLQAFLEMFWIADFNLDAAHHYADIRVNLESKGTPIGPLDLLIAAQVRSLGATLITANVGEFQRVEDLKIRDWK